MRNDPVRHAGRKSRRGRRSRRRSHGANRSNQPTPLASRAHEEPQSLWQKICAFFGSRTPKTAANGANGSRREKDRGVPRRRKPVIVEVTTPKLYVGNLSFDATESDLFDLFRGVGMVQNAEVVCHRDSQLSKGFAFVMMGSTEEALRAVEVLHDKDFMGRKLVVSGAKSQNLVDCR